MQEFVWHVNPKDVDFLVELLYLLENHEITEEDYIETLRTIGFPPEASPGDTVRIVFHRTAMSYGRKHERN